VGLALVAGLRIAVAAPFECRWTEAPIRIDGKADEPAWEQAQVIDGFRLSWLGKEERPSATATKARLLWDREYLYFFAEMEDRDVYAKITEHNGETWHDDVFELFFKPSTNATGYYEFEINATNTVFDFFIPSRGAVGYPGFEKDKRFHLETVVLVRGSLNDWKDKDEGWSVEGRIPWRDFLRTGGRPEPGEAWKFALCRYDYTTGREQPELSSSAPLQKPDFHRYEDYSDLRFIGPRSTMSRYGIDQRPLWTNSHVIGSPDPPLPYQAVRVFSNLNVHLPVAIAHEPGSDRILFLEHSVPWSGAGILRRFEAKPDVTKIENLIEFEDIAYGMTFHPGFKTNGFIYIGSNGPQNASKKKTRVVRYTISREAPFKIDPTSKLLIIEWDSDGHNGGDVAFGLDGMLYVTSGDGTSDSDANIVGQDLTKLTAKVLRLDVDHPADGKSYSVPKDNPFVGRAEVRPETWAYGLRNPWRITTDRETGRIWVGENGQDLWEMARLLVRGANYGWSVYEGSHAFNLNRKLGPEPVTFPTIEHPHSEFRSLTGGIVYYGKKFPDLRGAYIYGDWSTGRIWGGRHDGKRMVWHRELADTPFAITGFGTDPDGELLLIDEQTGFYALHRTDADSSTNHFPSRLSETGLFVSTAKHEPDPGLIPYSVNSPLWSDGAYKERFIALPNEGKIEFTHNRGWTLPEGAVLVKTFSLEMRDGDPASRKRIETRLLTRQQKEWVGYSYIWNEDQTDAVLVEASGRDKTFQLASTRGNKARQQTWHYPSRTECMVCHSRAANFVLGLTEAQMNKAHPYANGSDNQLRVLEHLGVLQVNWLEYEKQAVPRDLAQAGASASDAAAEMELFELPKNQREPVTSSKLLPRNPERMRRLADPYSAAWSLDDRARSYLQANCAHCHVEAGGGNSLMDLEFTTALKNMRVLDVKPQHHTFDISDARLLSPGHPERSVLLHRISTRDTGHMPPLATSIVDAEAVELLAGWIRQVKAP